MTRLTWDAVDRHYEYGLDRGVFYPQSGPGEPWNGLVSVQESPSETSGSSRFLDGIHIGANRKAGEFAGTIDAFTYPNSFYEDVNRPRRPKSFGLSYRITTDQASHIHLVYNLLLTPTENSYTQQETAPLSWSFSTRALPVPGFKPTAHLIIDASQAYSSTLEAIESVLYGDNSKTASLPSPTAILEIFEENALLRIIDHGDGTWTAIGPDEAITMLDATSFEINWPSAVCIDEETYTISSL